jgi:hypothetical protein
MREEREALVLCLSLPLFDLPSNREGWEVFVLVFCLGMILFTRESKIVFYTFVIAN